MDGNTIRQANRVEAGGPGSGKRFVTWCAAEVEHLAGATLPEAVERLCERSGAPYAAVQWGGETYLVPSSAADVPTYRVVLQEVRHGR